MKPYRGTIFPCLFPWGAPPGWIYGIYTCEHLGHVHFALFRSATHHATFCLCCLLPSLCCRAATMCQNNKNTRNTNFGPISFCWFLPSVYQQMLFGLDSDRLCAPERIIESQTHRFLFGESACWILALILRYILLCFDWHRTWPQNVILDK